MIKKKWCCRRGDDGHMRELSFATLATFKQKGNFLEGTRKIPFHPYFYSFIPKKKKKNLLKFVSFIYFIFHLGFGFQLSPNINICVT